MKSSLLPARFPRRFCSVGAALTALAGSPAAARAQTAPAVAQLDPVVTTATRTPAAPQTIGAVVDVISAAVLARRQVTSLGSALGLIAGAPHFATGAGGAVNSLFLRGANSVPAAHAVHTADVLAAGTLPYDPVAQAVHVGVDATLL